MAGASWEDAVKQKNILGAGKEAAERQLLVSARSAG